MSAPQPFARRIAADRPAVAVIGAGFSGVLTAFHLLRAPQGPRVVLIERGPRFGPGAAYATASPHHLLNVRGANMSALPEAPSHFLDWLGAAGGGDVFVTRERYGQYLQSLLRQAASGGRLTFEHDAAVAAAPAGEDWTVTLAMGRTLRVEQVVLAIGNLPPPAPDGVHDAVLASDRWIADPWAWIGRDQAVGGDVLLVGAGLTAVDVALAIGERRPGARILALSRHGLAPRAHAATPGEPAAAQPPAGSPAAMLRQLRAAADQDWRATGDTLRPHVQDIWRRWSLAERRRFLRHARPWWEVIRHRVAPEVAAHLEAMRAAGRFSVVAGRLRSLTLTDDGLEAAWSPRGETGVVRRGFAQAINCAGPLSDASRSGEPVVEALVAAGLARADACGLGLDVDEDARSIGADGHPVKGLFVVGPLGRGQVYEMTSVPDIRIQAAKVAATLVDDLAARGSRLPVQDALACDLRTHLQEAAAELEVQIDVAAASRRSRSAWELKGRRDALNDLMAWLDSREDRGQG